MPIALIPMAANVALIVHARTLLTELLAQMRRAPRYVRKVQAEWIAMAERTVRD